jgi:hypothetical protein
MKKILLNFLGLLGFCFSLTILFLSMRAVMNVGGSCAEGGPYQIQVHCPQGTAYLTPLSIFGMIGTTLLYVLSSVPFKNRPQWWQFFWSALFVSLGWNFLEFAFFPPFGNGIEISWLICGIMFVLMGLAPLFAFDKSSWISSLIGEKLIYSPTQAVIVPKFYEARALLVLLHCLTAASGILLGIYIFNLS